MDRGGLQGMAPLTCEVTLLPYKRSILTALLIVSSDTRSLTSTSRSQTPRTWTSSNSRTGRVYNWKGTVQEIALVYTS